MACLVEPVFATWIEKERTRKGASFLKEEKMCTLVDGEFYSDDAVVILHVGHSMSIIIVILNTYYNTYGSLTSGTMMRMKCEVLTIKVNLWH